MVDESLSTSVLTDEPVTFHYFENGSKRGDRLLVSSDGYKYGVKVKILWISVRAAFAATMCLP